MARYVFDMGRELPAARHTVQLWLTLKREGCLHGLIWRGVVPDGWIVHQECALGSNTE